MSDDICVLCGGAAEETKVDDVTSSLIACGACGAVYRISDEERARAHLWTDAQRAGYPQRARACNDRGLVYIVGEGAEEDRAGRIGRLRRQFAAPPGPAEPPDQDV